LALSCEETDLAKLEGELERNTSAIRELISKYVDAGLSKKWLSAHAVKGWMGRTDDAYREVLRNIWVGFPRKITVCANNPRCSRVSLEPEIKALIKSQQVLLQVALSLSKEFERVYAKADAQALVHDAQELADKTKLLVEQIPKFRSVCDG